MKQKSNDTKQSMFKAQFDANLRANGGAVVLTVPKEMLEESDTPLGRYRVSIELVPLNKFGFPVQDQKEENCG